MIRHANWLLDQKRGTPEYEQRVARAQKAEEKEKLEAQQKEKNIIMEICWFLMMGRSLNYNFSAEPAFCSLVQI